MCKHSTKGRILLFIFRLGFQPIGREIASSYSAGSQREKGMLEDPQRVFLLWMKEEVLKQFISTHTFSPQLLKG